MIQIYTDGSSWHKTTQGGWGVVIIEGNNKVELNGACIGVSNNQMELFAVVQALLYLKEHNQATQEVLIHSDSEYVVLGITQWMKDWKAKNWRTATKKEVKNVQFWKFLDYFLEGKPNIKFKWVRGHNGDKHNEEADKLALAAWKKNTTIEKL